MEPRKFPCRKCVLKERGILTNLAVKYHTAAYSLPQQWDQGEKQKCKSKSDVKTKEGIGSGKHF